MTCLPEEMREHVFFSSGTTSSSRSKHYHCTLSIKLYETSIWNWFLAHVWPMAFEATNPCSNPIVCILTPPPESAPESSLVHMFGLIASRFGNAEFCAQKSTSGYWSPDFTRVIKTFEKAIRLSAPVLTLTPASALVLLLEFMSKHSVSIKLAPLLCHNGNRWIQRTSKTSPQIQTLCNRRRSFRSFLKTGLSVNTGCANSVLKPTTTQ